MPADPDAAPEAVERQYRKRPVVIEAVQWFAQGHAPTWAQPHVTERPDYCFVHTLEGEMRCSPGDWLIRGVAGEVYPCKPDIFAATYEPASNASVAEAAEVERLRAEVLELKARSAAASKRLGDLKAMISHAEDGLDGPPTMATTEHIIWSARCYLDGVRGPYLTEARSALGGAS